MDGAEVLGNIVNNSATEYDTNILNFLMHLILQLTVDGRRVRQVLLGLYFLQYLVLEIINLLFLLLLLLLFLTGILRGARIRGRLVVPSRVLGVF